MNRINEITSHLETLKSGGKIHIKESRKGSFTRWCNGKVTDECIRRGKNSSDPRIRKKATFAANARTWRHQQGGSLVYNPFMVESSEPKQQYREETGLFDVDPKRDNLVVEPVQPWTLSDGYLSTYEKPITDNLVTRGVTEFKQEGIDVGNMRDLLDKFEEAGISVRVTSGKENRKTKSGKQSKHSVADAIDITPIKGQTYTDLKNQIIKNPELLKYMRENRIGIIDETDPLIKMKTGATGDHWHISRNENFALHGFDKMFGRE